MRFGADSRFFFCLSVDRRGQDPGCESNPTLSARGSPADTLSFLYVLQLQEKKRELASAALSGTKLNVGKGGNRLGVDELMMLFKVRRSETSRFACVVDSVLT